MRVITLSTSGAVQEQTWDEKSFHMWRLGRIDGLVRTATSLDFHLEIWSVADDETGGVNQLGAELAERLCEPSTTDFRTPYTGGMVITARERCGLVAGQTELVMGQIESILAPVPEPAAA